jgi:hypothetical protein
MTDIELYGGEEQFATPVCKVPGSYNILQISAVAFDMDGKVNDPHELMQTEDCWFDAIIPGWPDHVDLDAVQWWAMPMQDEARRSLIKGAEERGEELGTALDRFSRFVRTRLGKKGGHWANPPGFDLGTIRAHYSQLRRPTPWGHRHERCMRTLMSLAKGLAPGKLPDMGDAARASMGLIRHNGLHDAAAQAGLVQAAYRAVGLRAGDYARTSQSTASASG